MVLQSGVPFSFNVIYPAIDDSTLYVGMTVLDMTSGSAVQVGDLIPMVNVMGNMFAATFTPDAEKCYQTYKAVYMDDTYADRDPNYIEAGDSFEARDFSTVSVEVDLSSVVDGIANAVWDAALADHTVAGTFGVFVKKLLTVGKFLGLQ